MKRLITLNTVHKIFISLKNQEPILFGYIPITLKLLHKGFIVEVWVICSEFSKEQIMLYDSHIKLEGIF